MRVDHNKLVRDHIPAIVRDDGGRAVTRVLGDEEYRRALLVKLKEEAEEAHDASVDELPAELADVLEVLQALARTLSMSWDDLAGLAADKRDKRGGFENRLFLEYVERPT